MATSPLPRLAPGPGRAIGGHGKETRADRALRQTGIDETAYAAVLTDVTRLLGSARHAAARSVNSIMAASYWAAGRRIVESEQEGKGRAGIRVPADRAARRRPDPCRFGRGFGAVNLCPDAEVLVESRWGG